MALDDHSAPEGKDKKHARPAKTRARAKSAKPKTKRATSSQKKAAPEHKHNHAASAASNSEQLAKNLSQVFETSQKMIATSMQKSDESPLHAPQNPDPLNVGQAFAKLTSQLLTHPEQVIEAQSKLWQAHMDLWQHAAERAMGADVSPFIEPEKGDKRFRHEDWEDNQVFDVIKQSYLITAKWLEDTVKNVEGLDEATQEKVQFYTKQMTDAFSPSNFAMTNPEVLRATFESNGENLVRGLNNIISDLERGKGKLSISQTDMDYFEVGRNLATAPGKVVFQNEFFQLLQYEPSTEQVYERPLLIFPPWINKFYILDLREDNSFIRWCVDKGYTVFVVSWVNPDERLADNDFEDYVHDGLYAALEAVEKATGCQQVNTIGYCIGGTLLGTSLALMAAKNDHRIQSATFFAAQLDFEHAGDLKIFVDDEQLASMEAQMEAAGGFLEGSSMATTFNMLRSNDLIWSFVVNNYLLGKEPFRFDLLYWNADTTRMPQALHMYYLKNFYHKNKLATGHLKIDGVPLDLSKVTIPIYLQSGKDDHIAPCKSVFKASHLFGGPVRFMIAGSGHIAGVINPPSAHKYQYWINEKNADSVEEWLEGAEEHPGSWWNDWDQWLSPKSGKKVPARKPGDGGLDILEDAPGSYVKIRSNA